MLDPIFIIKTAGLLGISLIVFCESGLFFGFFLPGDTLLFASGLFALQGFFPIALVIFVCAIASMLGGLVGYWSGKTLGRKLLERRDSFFFNKNKIDSVEKFYNKYGPITILVARFIPFVRTFSPIIAGVGKMRYKSFLIYNTLGAILWGTVVPLLGYYFGGLIPNPDRFILPVAILIIGFSFLPFVIKVVHHFIYKRR